MGKLQRDVWLMVMAQCFNVQRGRLYAQNNPVDGIETTVVKQTVAVKVDHCLATGRGCGHRCRRPHQQEQHAHGNHPNPCRGTQCVMMVRSLGTAFRRGVGSASSARQVTQSCVQIWDVALMDGIIAARAIVTTKAEKGLAQRM